MPKTIKNIPVAEDFMETARSFGNYDLASALADLIDNSITAGARNIDIIAEFEKDEIRIVDDGKGIAQSELIKAMRLGSQNPRNERKDDDLGRFGLGLKTASFSQADKLTVLTQSENGEFNGALWDLNNCANFEMTLFEGFEEVSKLSQSSIKTKPGTEVVWKNLTRLRTGSRKDSIEADFYDTVNAAKDELGLVFHRYLDDEMPDEKINLNLNGSKIVSHDPYFRKNKACQKPKSHKEILDGKEIKFTQFTLPHFSKLTGAEKLKIGGKEGIVRNSGFYIYRKRRLIIRGTWFKLVPHSELYKLSRVMVDIPNALDDQWKITVDKSGAQLPGALKKRLAQWVKQSVVKRSKKVFTHKGNQELKAVGPIWERKSRADKDEYKISQKHPLFERFAAKLDLEQKKSFEHIIELIEKCLPVNDIHLAVSEDDVTKQVFQGYLELPPELMEWVRVQSIDYLKSGKMKQEIIDYFSSVQPFSDFPEQVLDCIQSVSLPDGEN